MIKQIGLLLRGHLILLIARMITDQIGLHSVLLPLLIMIKDLIFLIFVIICQWLLVLRKDEKKLVNLLLGSKKKHKSSASQ